MAGHRRRPRRLALPKRWWSAMSASTGDRSPRRTSRAAVSCRGPIMLPQPRAADPRRQGDPAGDREEDRVDAACAARSRRSRKFVPSPLPERCAALTGRSSSPEARPAARPRTSASAPSTEERPGDPGVGRPASPGTAGEGQLLRSHGRAHRLQHVARAARRAGSARCSRCTGGRARRRVGGQLVGEAPLRQQHLPPGERRVGRGGQLADAGAGGALVAARRRGLAAALAELARGIRADGVDGAVDAMEPSFRLEPLDGVGSQLFRALAANSSKTLRDPVELVVAELDDLDPLRLEGESVAASPGRCPAGTGELRAADVVALVVVARTCSRSAGRRRCPRTASRRSRRC